MASNKSVSVMGRVRDCFKIHKSEAQMAMDALQIPTEERNGYLNILKGENKMSKMKIAAIQMPTVIDKMENVKTVKNYLEKIKDEKPDFVILQEMF